MNLENLLKAYIQTLDGQDRKADFIYNGNEYFEIDWPGLEGLVFYLKNDTMVIEENPNIHVRSKL